MSTQDKTRFTTLPSLCELKGKNQISIIEKHRGKNFESICNLTPLEKHQHQLFQASRSANPFKYDSTSTDITGRFTDPNAWISSLSFLLKTSTQQALLISKMSEWQGLISKKKSITSNTNRIKNLLFMLECQCNTFHFLFNNFSSW